MKVLNNRYEIIHKKKQFDNETLYLAKDLNSGNNLYILFLEQSLDILSPFIYNFIRDYIYQKEILVPCVVHPFDFCSIESIDGSAVDSSSCFITFPYMKGTFLSDYKFKTKEQKTEIIQSIWINLQWMHKNNYSIGFFNEDFILIDETMNPYFFRVYNQQNIEKDIPLFFQSLSRFIPQNDKFSFFKKEMEINQSIYNRIILYFKKNTKFSIDLTPQLKTEIDRSFQQAIRNQSNKLLFNFPCFPPVFFSFIDEYFINLGKINDFFVLSCYTTPDPYSLFFELIRKFAINNELSRFIDMQDFIIQSFVNNEIVKNNQFQQISLKTIIQKILEMVQSSLLFKPLCMIVHNLDYADNKSIKLVEALAGINQGNSRLILVFSSQTKIQGINQSFIHFNHFIDHQKNTEIRNTMIEKIRNLLIMVDSKNDFLDNLNISDMLFLIENKPDDFIVFKGNVIDFNIQKILSMILESKFNFLDSLLKNVNLETFILYFNLFDKPTRIKYFQNIEGHNMIPIVEFLIQNKIFIFIDRESFTPYDIRVTRLIINEFTNKPYNRKKILENVCHIYSQNVEILGTTEIYTYFAYLCELKKFREAAQLIDNKILLQLNPNLQYLNELYFPFMQKFFNNRTKISKLKDSQAHIILRIFYAKIRYYNNPEKMENLMLSLSYNEKEIDSEFTMRIILEKVLYFLKNHNIKPIIKEMEYLDKNNTKMDDTIKKLYYFVKTEFYFTKFDHEDAVKTAREGIKLLDKDSGFDRDLFLPFIHRLTNSIIYTGGFKRTIAYLNYFLKMAKIQNNAHFMFSAHNNLGIIYYRNKYYEKAYEYFSKSLEYAKKTYIKANKFVIYNNTNLLEMNKKLRITRSKEALILAKGLPDKTHIYLALCNTFLYLIEYFDLDQIKKIINQYNKIIFSEPVDLAGVVARRVLHIYTILLYPLYLISDFKSIKRIHSLLKILKNSLSDPDIAKEIKYLFPVLFTLITYLLEINGEMEGDPGKTKIELKSLIIKYSKDKDRIENTEFFLHFLGTYGPCLFEESEFEQLIDNLVNIYKDNPRLLNSNIIIYNRIKKYETKKDEATLYFYMNRFFKLYETDPWSSSGSYFKFYNLLYYFKLMQKEDPAKTSSYTILLKEIGKPYYEYRKKYGSSNTFNEKLFFPKLIEQFQPIIQNTFIKQGIQDYPPMLPEKEKQFELKISPYLPSDTYEKTFSHLLIHLGKDLGFDRIIFYLYKDNYFINSFHHIKENILYLEKDPVYNFWNENYEILLQPRIYNLKNNTLIQVMTLPIFNDKDFNRFLYFKNNNHNILNHSLPFYGFIYLDKKLPTKNTVSIQSLQYLVLFLSKFYDQIQSENLYMKDSLTGFYFKDIFYNKAYQVIHRKGNRKQHCFLMIDIDDFKSINDVYGHQKGDYVLKKTSVIIQNSLRNSDIIARYGGEEFIILLPNTETSTGMKIAERIRTNIEKARIMGNLRSYSISIGVSVFPDDGKILEELVSKSDKALYLAKKSGKNKTIVYH